MKLSQCKFKLPTRMSMDATPIVQDFDLSSTDIPDICKASPIPAAGHKNLKFERPNYGKKKSII